MFTCTIELTGRTRNDLVLALKEIERMTATGFMSGNAKHLGGTYRFETVKAAKAAKITPEKDDDFHVANEDEPDVPYYCQDCSHEALETDFIPCDGNPAPHVCPECGRTNVFFKDPPETA